MKILIVPNKISSIIFPALYLFQLSTVSTLQPGQSNLLRGDTGQRNRVNPFDSDFDRRRQNIWASNYATDDEDDNFDASGDGSGAGSRITDDDDLFRNMNTVNSNTPPSPIDPLINRNNNNNAVNNNNNNNPPPPLVQKDTRPVAYSDNVVVPPVVDPETQKGERGERGERGDTGPPGAIGPPGPQGPQGEKGAIGIRGPKGYPGNPGSRGIDGIDGKDGLRGPPGPAGIGKDGKPGLPGSIGPPGMVGPAGKDGERGPAGPVGPRGPEGPQGPIGPQGKPGDEPDFDDFLTEFELKDLADRLEPHFDSFNEPVVVSGKDGEDGEDGAIGPQGPPGLRGPPGRDGVDGFDGAKGQQGDRGEPGPPGQHGYCLARSPTDYKVGVDVNLQSCPRGEDGKDGAPGPRGSQGVQGLPGPAGINGQDGAIGPQGPRGEPGPQGPPGPPGEVKFSQGRASSVMNGRDGPPGPQGERGDVGPVGPPGPAGRDGPAGLQGPEGQQGPPGPHGKHGKDGAVGQQGPEGPPGPPGPVGPSGPPGERGLQGNPGTGRNGLDGRDGDTGPRGLRGYTGKEGPQGPQGPAGLTGERGETGPQGPPGPPGVCDASLCGGRKNRDQAPAPFADVQAPQTQSSGAFGNRYAIYSTFTELNNHYHKVPEGSMGFILDGQRLFVKTAKGWSQVIIGTPMPPPCIDCAQKEKPGQILPPPKPAHGVIDRPKDFSPVPHTTSCRDITHLKLVALDKVYTGDIGGLKNADFQCFRKSRTSALDGTYRAFLSNNNQDLRNIVSEHSRQNVPICNLNDEMLFKSWDELISNKGAMNPQARILTFKGRDISTLTYPRYIWHGSAMNGVRESSGYCDSWRASNTQMFGRVSPIKDKMLLSEQSLRCDEQAWVLCIKIRERRPSRRRGYGALRRRREIDFYTNDDDN